ncbi:unnamed protein product [Ambrosiozyma monospora]|uniref:Unnamed protein product n=1 Tax=Ambrosiozyma monospora TaxID=43982 RepID=A0A9W7DHT5_AMBMO|nr:unnamed protein product [Ambrosiozyma monospora]
MLATQLSTKLCQTAAHSAATTTLPATHLLLKLYCTWNHTSRTIEDSHLLFDKPLYTVPTKITPIPAKPLLVTLDAYDTIYTPIQSIPVQYNAISSKYGINLSVSEIKFRFGKAFKMLFTQYPDYGKEEGISIYQFWKMVLAEMYTPWNPNKSDSERQKAAMDGQLGERLPLSDVCFEKMIHEITRHFETKQAYRIFNDVVPFLNQCQDNHVKMCVASNAEATIMKLILKEFELHPYFTPQDVFLSYNLGVHKPDPKFFEIILQQQMMRHFGGGFDWRKLIDRTWHVGDEFEKDTVCVSKLGIGSILIDRDYSSGFLKHGEGVKRIDDKFYVVDSLDKLGWLFGFKRNN